VTGRRSDILLGALGGVAIANGVFLGLTAYGLLAAGLHLLGGSAPGAGWALALGALAGVALLAVANLRERAQRGAGGPGELPLRQPYGKLAARLQALVAASSLRQSPALWVLPSTQPNAFAAGSSRDDAAIVLTTGLLALLDRDEENAVLARLVAQVESEDLRAIGRADAVAESVEEVADRKGRVLWGPKEILLGTWPFWAVVFGGTLLLGVLQGAGGNESLLILVRGVVAFGLLFAFLRTARDCAAGLLQAFLFVTFFGPLSLIELALAPPTALALSRLVSRARVFEADARGAELNGDRAALASALVKLEQAPPTWDDARLERRRFALLVAPRERNRYRAWLARIYATHPSLPSRIEELKQPGAARRAAQDDSRATIADGRPRDGLEQSG
jgi:heat shock protein HtpX